MRDESISSSNDRIRVVRFELLLDRFLPFPRQDRSSFPVFSFSLKERRYMSVGKKDAGCLVDGYQCRREAGKKKKNSLSLGQLPRFRLQALHLLQRLLRARRTGVFLGQQMSRYLLPYFARFERSLLLQRSNRLRQNAKRQKIDQRLGHLQNEEIISTSRSEGDTVTSKEKMNQELRDSPSHSVSST